MSNTAKGRPLDPRRVLMTLRNSPKLVGSALAIGAVVALVVWALLPNSYESHAVLLYEGQSAKEELNLRELRTIASSVELTSSLIEVQQRLSIEGGPDKLRPRIDAVLEEDSNLLRIHGRADTAGAARRFVIAVLDVFLARQSKLARNRNLERIEELKKDLGKASTALGRKRTTLRTFLDGEGIGDLDAELLQAQEQVKRLTAASDNAGAVVGGEKERLSRLRKLAEELPGGGGSSSARRRLRKAKAELVEARTSLSNEHPRVQSLMATVKALKKKIESSGPSTSDVRADNRNQSKVAASEGKQQAFQELAVAAEERLKKLSRIQGRVSELQEATDVAQAHVTELQGELAEQKDQSDSIDSGFRVVVPPLSPESSLHAKRNIFIALGVLLLGFLIATLVRLFRRLGGLKVFTAPEVAWWGDGPVLGMTTWPKEEGALDALVAELEDFGKKARGKTLVIPASESERELASSFASELSDAPWLAAGILDVTASSDGMQAAERPSKEALITPPPKSEPPPALKAEPTKPKPQRKLRSEKATMIGVSAIPDPTDEANEAGNISLKPAKLPSFPESDPEDTSAERRFESYLEKKMSTPPKAISSRPPKSKDLGKTLMMGSQPPPEETESKYPRPPSKKSSVPPAQAASVFKPTSSDRKKVPAVQKATVRTTYVDGPKGTVVLEDGTVSSPKYDSPAQSKRDKISRQVMRAAIRVLRDTQDETPAFGVKLPAEPATASIALAWNGPLSGPVFRRAVRLSDRVVVLVESGERTGQELRSLRARIGRDTGVGFLVVGSSASHAESTDRVGNVEKFWGTIAT